MHVSGVGNTRGDTCVYQRRTRGRNMIRYKVKITILEESLDYQSHLLQHLPEENKQENG